MDTEIVVMVRQNCSNTDGGPSQNSVLYSNPPYCHTNFVFQNSKYHGNTICVEPDQAPLEIAKTQSPYR